MRSSFFKLGALLTASLVLNGCGNKSNADDDDAGAGNTPSAGGNTAAGNGGRPSGGAAGFATGGMGGRAGGGGLGEGGEAASTSCGDGVLDALEQCDGFALADNTCERLGFGPGPLGCRANCTFDLKGCTASANCGNAVLDGLEQCDNGAMNSDDTPNACRVNCALPSCGDDVQDDGEGCDDGALNSDFRAGTCRTDCQLAHCGDGLIDEGEACDGERLGRATCVREGFTGGTLSCADDCTLDTSSCVTCGDGVADGAEGDPEFEECDATDFRGKDCTDFDFPGGKLTCVGCTIVTTSCGDEPIECGNDLVEADELCDGTDFNGDTCADHGFTGGRLTCSQDCSSVSTSRCNTCGNGSIEPGEVCDDGNSEDDFTCSADCRSECGVGYGECDDDTSHFCGFDRSGKAVEMTEYCDPVQGLSCQDGLCKGPCAVSSLGSSYLGCDYYPTVVSNQVLSLSVGDYAVAVANTGTKTAHITVTQGATSIATSTAAAGDVAVMILPWTSLVTANTALLADGAYRLRTDQPVTVYQYNPLNYQKNGTATYTNDASLLLPTNTWTGNYVVAARNTWIFGGSTTYPGVYAVVAKEDDTEVTLTPSATGKIVYAGAGIAANGTGTVTLDAGDVLQVASNTGGGGPDVSDLTGTRVTANKPVQVIGGHTCTNVPYNVTACDHLEEAMLPIETLGTTYIVATPLITATTEKARMVRVIATEANTTVSYSPAQTGAPTSLTNAGDYFELSQSAETFQITANKRILVAEYALGQDAGGNTGDPDMVLAVPVQQYRTQYLFHAPVNYLTNYVNITAPANATVALDDQTLAAGTAIGSTGYSIRRVQLDNSGTGNHTIEASDRVGITVYGYGSYTSYWYPGGLELTQF
ncbi:MAG TPA: hypothetical protein VFV94_11425 [Polyangiaceae bacterium]|nr:hypothetical protein [Polyangiaceae bacterium]